MFFSRVANTVRPILISIPLAQLHGGKIWIFGTLVAETDRNIATVAYAAGGRSHLGAKVRAAVEADSAKLESLGYCVKSLYVDDGETAEAAPTNALASGGYDS